MHPVTFLSHSSQTNVYTQFAVASTAGSKHAERVSSACMRGCDSLAGANQAAGVGDSVVAVRAMRAVLCDSLE